MSSFIEIGSAVPQKNIFEGFVPCMGMTTILVLRPMFLPITFGLAVSEKKMFEKPVDGRTDDGCTTVAGCLPIL